MIATHGAHTWERFTGELPDRVVILRALQLGDLLCAVPAFRALRASLPGAEIVLVGLPWARELVHRFAHYLDGFREFPGWPGLPERFSAIDKIPGFLSAIQAERFDLAIQLHGSGIYVNELIALFGAQRCAGFCSPPAYCPDPALFMAWPETGSEIRRLLQMTEFLGCASQGEHLEFPLRDDDYQALERLPGIEQLHPGKYVCIHAGASTSLRRWPTEHFAIVARALYDFGFHVVLTGTASEANLADDVASVSQAPCLNLAGLTELGTLGALLQGARLLICNDTGVSHLAAALDIPSVVISSAANGERWAPLNAERHRFLCGLTSVQPEQVIVEAEDLLDDEWRPGASANETTVTAAS